LDKSPDAFRTISEVADDLDVPQHVLRFWESRFAQIRPMKRAGGRRYYRSDDVDLLRGIRQLLYGEGYTIRGVQRILKEQGVKFVQSAWQPGAIEPARRAADDDGASEEDVTAAAEERDTERGQGLRGLLPSLLGRDRGDELPLGERREPTLDDPKAASPKRTRSDRISTREDEPQSRTAELPLGRGDAIAREDLRKLHAALHELGECRRLLDTVLR
jgi:DNA-binding transcriptional MerR regulator